VKFVAADAMSEAVSQRLHGVGLLLDEYKAALPQTGCHKFLQGIRILLSAVGSYHLEWCEHIDRSYADSPSVRADLLRSVSSNCLELLRNIQEEFLPLIEISLRQPPFLIQPAFEYSISVFARSAEFELTLVPAFGYHYGFYGKHEFVQTALSKLGHFTKSDYYINEAKALPPWSFFLVYPIVERESALNQVVVIHEVAHVISELRDIHTKVLPTSLDLDKEAFDAYVKEVSEKQADIPANVIESRCFARCSSMLESWTKEIVSDVIAIHSVGPAYLFSFLEFFANAGMEDLHDGEHPAPSYRCEILLEELKFMDYLSDNDGVLTPLREQLGAVTPEVSEACKVAVGRYKSESLVAHKTLEAYRTDILDKLRRLTKGYTFSAERYAKEVPPLVDQLGQAVAPGPRYTRTSPPSALSVPAILNAGWHLYKLDFHSFRSLFVNSIEAPDILVNLNRLLLKSLESNYVVTRYYS
jgi:hypothetical protein